MADGEYEKNQEKSPGQEEASDLEYPWNLFCLSSVHVSLCDWSHVKQFATKKKAQNEQSHFNYINIYSMASEERQERILTRYLVPWKGWTVPYPARHCRTGSSYCSPPHTEKILEGQ